jgi:hypothetical protein
VVLVVVGMKEWRIYAEVFNKEQVLAEGDCRKAALNVDMMWDSFKW